MNTLKEIKERFDTWSLQEAEKKELSKGWQYTLDQVLAAEGTQQTLLDFVVAVFEDEKLSEQMLSAILGVLPEEAIQDVVDYLERTILNKRQPEAEMAERLSKKEKAKRKKRKVFNHAPEDDADIPDEMRALANGVVGNRSDEELEENECAGNPFRNSKGRYSSSDAYGSYTLPKKPKRCATSSGQGRRGAGSRKLDKSEEPCGRKSRKKCKDGEER